MNSLKLVSRYAIVTLFMIFIHRFKLSFPQVILTKTCCYLLLCFFLDYIIPRYTSIIYHDKNTSQNNNDMTMRVVLNVFINYCMHIFCLWLTIRNAKNYELTGRNIMINYLYAVPLGLLSSVLFYYTHIFLHSKYIYGLVHKKHHTYNHPSSAVAIYTSIPDFILSNCISFFVPYYILKVHPYFIMGYTFIGLFDVFVNHTSYYFENKFLDIFLGGSKFHYIHHAKYKYNYGLNNKLLDRLHGTCDNETTDYELY